MKSTKLLSAATGMVLLANALFSQSNINQTLSVNANGAAPDPSAQLDVSATDKGLLVPRMTTAQRTAIASPATGLLVFDTDTGSFWFFGGSWKNLSAALADADNDTKIQVEESPDEDVIRFDLGGTESLILQKNTGGQARLELPSPFFNTFIGQDAGSSNQNGSSNAALGQGAMQANTIGFNNTAVGANALSSNTEGSGNTAIGRNSLQSNQNGYDNTACGLKALITNASGHSNTAVGFQALNTNINGNGNTALGLQSLLANVSGSNNTAIGATAAFTDNNLDNTTALGYLAGGVGNASNRIEIGNTSVSFIGGQVNWSTYSDARIKTKVQENVPGLDFIKKLRPVTYHLDIHKQNEICFMGKKEIGDWGSQYDIEQKQMTGFIAQEVEAAAHAIGYDFSGVEQAKDEVGMYSVKYAEFVVPLVKAVQEQQKIIENAESRMENLETENAALKTELQGYKAQLAKIAAALQGMGVDIR
jgi:hypothetical protein